MASTPIPVADLPDLEDQQPGDFVHIDDGAKDFKERRDAFLLAENGAVRNAQLTFNTTSSVDVGLAGAISLAKDSTNDYNMFFAGVKTIDFTVTGINGLDAGAVAVDTWYAIFIIGDSTGSSATETLASTSELAPTLPAGYDIFRRIGWARTTVAALLRAFEQYGNGSNREYKYTGTETTLQPLVGGNAIAYAAVSLATLVPTTSKHVILISQFDGSAATPFFRIRETGSAVALPVTAYVFATATGGASSSTVLCVTDSAQSIDYIVNNAASALTLAVAGYKDTV